MRQTWYDIVPQQAGWAIRTGEIARGSYATRDEAFQAAVTAARKMRYKGKCVTVRILHPTPDDGSEN